MYEIYEILCYMFYKMLFVNFYNLKLSLISRGIYICLPYITHVIGRYMNISFISTEINIQETIFNSVFMFHNTY